MPRPEEPLGQGRLITQLPRQEPPRHDRSWFGLPPIEDETEADRAKRNRKLIEIGNDFLASVEAERAAKLLRETSMLRLTGMTMMVPYGAGWKCLSLPKRDLKRNLALVGLFRLPKVDGDIYDCEVRVTHNPANRQQSYGWVLEKWGRQVRDADGTRIRRTSPTVVDRPSSGGTLRVVVTDLFGTVTTLSDGGSATRPNHRFIGVILGHARGPHYVTVVGPAASMARWEESIFKFIESAKLTRLGVPLP